MMWRKGLIQVDIQSMKTGHYPSEKIKDALGGKIMTEFVALRGKMYAYRQGNEGKALQRHKKVCGL